MFIILIFNFSIESYRLLITSPNNVGLITNPPLPLYFKRKSITFSYILNRNLIVSFYYHTYKSTAFFLSDVNIDITRLGFPNTVFINIINGFYNPFIIDTVYLNISIFISSIGSGIC